MTARATPQPAPREAAPETLFLLFLAAHISAASIIFMTVAPELPRSLLRAGDPAHALAMHSALERVLLASVFLPPLAPTLLLLSTCVVLRHARSNPNTRRWIALGFIPLAIERVAQATSVLATSALPVTPGGLLELHRQFTSGLATPLTLAGVELSAAARYWTESITIAAAISVACAGMALAHAREARRAERARPTRKVYPGDAASAIAAVSVAFVAIVLAMQVLAPVVLPLFFKVSG
jgi:hypothetical protein